MFIKGTGTRDYNWLKVAWCDRSWLEENLANNHNFSNAAFSFILN
jgi:hypothetical protein